jgi:hypothetical protein
MAGRHGRIELIAGTLVALLGGAALPSSAQAPASFNPAVTFPTGALPITVGIADVNGDGKPDLVTVNTGANTVSILLGNGAGSFGPKTDFATGAVPHGLAIADLDGDGNPDLVVANTGANTVSVLLGTGTGTFTAATDFPTGVAPFFVAVGDLNGDGIPDLVVVNVGTDTVSVLLGVGDGTFGPKTDFPTGAGARAVAIGDLNGDGVPDLVVANVSASTVSVLLGMGTGSFGPKTDFPTGAGARDVAIADVNGDGKLDVVVANQDAGTVSVLLGMGDGTLGPKTDFLVGAGPRSVAIGDVNEDGILDLVVANADSNTVSVLLGTGTGSFAAKTDLATGAGTRPFSVAIGDLNGNGQRDIAVANVNANTVSVFLNTIAPVIAVTPSSQGFGNVAVGSTADRTFTVTNAGGGTLTGSASTSAPFSIVGEGSYNLSAGASKTVTARFQPTAVAIVSGNVNFTYGDGSVFVSRGLMGTGTNSVPVPVLGALSPSSATAGSAAFTLTVSGTNFVASSVVRWNGSNRTTTFVSGIELRAAIPASDVALAGSAQVTVFDFLPIGETSNTLTFTISQAVPVLAALSPSSATAGGAGFTLTVTGANFVAPSVVRWNGSERPTTFVSSTELRAAISASDIAMAGSAQITVFNPIPGGGTSGALTFTITTQMFTLTVTVRGSGVGSVVSTPAGINCSSVCSGTFTVNAVTLTEASAADASFKSWNGSCGGASPSCTVALGPTAVTATFSAVFTDATLTAQGTAIKAVHITDLRSAIDTLRTRSGLSAFPYTDATLTPGSTVVRGVHLSELRAALRDVPGSVGPFTDPTIAVGQTVIKATHLNELRQAVRDLE